MADVALRFTTAGTSEAIQSLNQVAQTTQRFASTTQQTLTQARVATQSFNFVLFDMARIARIDGRAGRARGMMTVFCTSAGRKSRAAAVTGAGRVPSSPFRRPRAGQGMGEGARTGRVRGGPLPSPFLL